MNVRIAALLIPLVLVSCAAPRTIRTLRDISPVVAELHAQPGTPDVTRLLEAAESSDREVRAEAVYSLTHFAKRLPAAAQRDRVERLFLKLAETDSDFNVRCMAVHGIGAYAIDKKDALPVVNRSLADVSRQVMIEATKVARIYKDESSLMPLLANLRTTGRWLKMETIRTLALFRDKRVDDAFLQIRNSEDDAAILEEITLALAKR